MPLIRNTDKYEFEPWSSKLLVRLVWTATPTTDVGWHVMTLDREWMNSQEYYRPGQVLPWVGIPLDEWLRQAERDFGLASKEMG